MPLPHNTDKLIHMFIYMILGFFLAGALPERDLWAIIIGMIYGISDEIHQSFVPFRSSSIYDWIADAVGVIVGVIIFSFWRKRNEKGGKR